MSRPRRFGIATEPIPSLGPQPGALAEVRGARIRQRL